MTWLTDMLFFIQKTKSEVLLWRAPLGALVTTELLMDSCLGPVL